MVGYSVLNVKAVVATFNQEKSLVGDFSVITNLRMELFEALVDTVAGVLVAADWHKICTYSIMRVSAGGGLVTQVLSFP